MLLAHLCHPACHLQSSLALACDRLKVFECSRQYLVTDYSSVGGFSLCDNANWLSLYCARRRPEEECSLVNIEHLSSWFQPLNFTCGIREVEACLPLVAQLLRVCSNHISVRRDGVKAGAVPVVGTKTCHCNENPHDIKYHGSAAAWQCGTRVRHKGARPSLSACRGIDSETVEVFAVVLDSAHFKLVEYKDLDLDRYRTRASVVQEQVTFERRRGQHSAKATLHVATDSIIF